MAPASKTSRLPLGRTPRRLSFERRIHLWLAAFSLPALLVTGLYTFALSGSHLTTDLAVGGLAFAWLIASAYFTDLLTRPLNTLSNVVAALREDDYSFRARGARRGDALGDLALEINALASTLQGQRSAMLDAVTLVERVLSSMQSPVLAFDDAARLRLVNAAARHTFTLTNVDLGAAAEGLQLASLLAVADQSLYTHPSSATPWSVRRAGFRLHGLPHTLFVLSDVTAALRKEERLAWHRLIRVLSHEINNSLTPIQSIAGSLRTRITAPLPGPTHTRDLLRGLTVIEDRAMALNRFLQAYQQLSRVPEPKLQPTEVAQLLSQVVQLETRLKPILTPGPDLTLLCDPDQIQQALINLLQNAADAALAQTERDPAVHVTWSVSAASVALTLTDNGLGLANTANLFVPFYTTKPQGSGIGLVLAQQIATAHGGSVVLKETATTQGCTAELILPLHPIQPLSR